VTVPQVVVGGSVAALVAADALAARRPVRLLLPRRGVGGGFLPLERDGRRLELGMRALELRYEGTGTPPPLERYRPEGDGHRPFVARVDAWVRDLVGNDALVDLAAPASYVEGRLGPELLLTSDLTGAPGLVGRVLAGRIAAEASRASASAGPAGWLAPEHRDRLWDVSLDEASLHQHGPTFHELFVGALTRKVRPAGGSDVVAALRRKLWAPLFWPQTLADAFAGRPPGFVPDRPLTVTTGGGAGPVVTALLDRLVHRGVEVVRHDGLRTLAVEDGDVVVETADGRVERARRPVLGVGAGELFAAAGIEHSVTRVRCVVAWVEVAEDDLVSLPGVVHVLDPAVPAYRVTPGERDASTGARVLCVELCHDVATDAAVATAAEVVRRTGLVREGAGVRGLTAVAAPAFTDPTAGNRSRHDAAWASWRERDWPAVVVGGAQAFGYDSFNEQVVQGLQAAERLG
jgi:hypothetical protein